MILRFKLLSIAGATALLSAPSSDAFAPASVVQSTRVRSRDAACSSGTARHQQAQFYDANGNPVSMPMVYDANGNLVPFNPAMQQPPAPAQSQQPPAPVQAQQPPLPPQVNPGPAIIEPPLPQKTKGTDSPRPVGYNPDAYTMSNTADVYFAQLKQDSKVRKIARMSGDVETANKVFADESVKQIGESWTDNPYTKEKNIAEARAEIEGTVRMQVQGDDAPKITSGISYKEKLAQMKANRTGAGGAVSPQAPPPNQQPAASAPPPPKVEQPKVGMPAPTKVISQQAADAPKVGMQTPPKVGQQIPTNVVPPPPVVSTPPPVAAATAATPSGAMGEDEVRGKVRTLQGLLLKHRGGPGFGAGRLKAPEAQRLEDTLEEVKGILRSEVGGGKPTVASAPPKVPAQTAPAPAQSAAAKMAPPPPRTAPVVPAPVQAAPAPAPAPAPAQLDPLAGSVACVEGALKAYKSAPPTGRKEAAMDLAAALMAAVSAANKYIAESDLEAHRAAMDAGPSAAVAAAAAANLGSAQPAPPAMGFPTTYAVTKPEEESAAPPQSTVSSPGDNTKQLEDVYNALVGARGASGKLGLKNISGDEATALKEKLQTMRTVLLDELHSAP